MPSSVGAENSCKNVRISVKSEQKQLMIFHCLSNVEA